MNSEKNKYPGINQNKSAHSKSGMQKMTESQQPFGKLNFIFIGVCIALIIIGFLLMSGPGSSIENGFNPDIFSTRRIVIGPAISFIGFLMMAFAILYSPRKSENKDKPDAKD